MQGRAGGLWTHATLETDCTHGQMLSKDGIGVPYTQITPDKRHHTRTSFWMPNGLVGEEKRERLYFLSHMSKLLLISVIILTSPCDKDYYSHLREKESEA